jgi:hypothetical protein
MNSVKGDESQIIGTGGTYYVMSQLAIRGYHASCTFGNAPFVDILVASHDGHKTISIQVKTARNARRWKGNLVNELQWTLGWKSAKHSTPNLFYAFIDLKNLSDTEPPDVYIIPSTWVKDYCAPWVDQVKWVRFHVHPDLVDPFKNKLDPIDEALK